MKKPSLAVIVLAKNEALMLANCLKTVKFAQQIIVIDHGSTDETHKIAESFGAQVIHFNHSSFARLREEGLKYIKKATWVMYLDPDERLTPTLAKEILVQLETTSAAALAFNRQNICYGQKFSAGGWENDQVTRIFRLESLKGWQGQIHESPIYDGQTVVLRSPLIHLTHRQTSDNLLKSSQWTIKEAQLLAKSGLKPVKMSTLLRKGLMEFWRRAIVKRGYRDGQAGLIEALVQAMNRIFVYIQVWELQQKPPLADRYQKIERDLNQAWQQAHSNQWFD